MIPFEETMKHEFIERSEFPSSAVVYTDGCCRGNGKKNAIGGIGVYWGPQHPRYNYALRYLYCYLETCLLCSFNPSIYKTL